MTNPPLDFSQFRASQSDSGEPVPSRLAGIIFAPVTTEQARLFGGIGRMLDRRGRQVRFAVPHESIASELRADWDGLIDVAGTAPSEDHPSRSARAAGADEIPSLRSQIGAYDAWRAGWSEPQRAAAAREALDFWTQTLARRGADAVVVWNGRDHVFVEAAVSIARTRGRTPLFMELGPLRRNPMTIAIGRGGVNAAAEFRRTDMLSQPLTAWESDRLATVRSRFSSQLCATAPPHERRRYAFLPLQVDDDTQLYYYMPHFPNQTELVRAVVAALPAELPLVLKLHPLADERRGRNLYEAVLRPQDRIASQRDDTLALLRGAETVITNNSSAGIEALMLERPVVVLGKAHYAGRGFTTDYDGRRLDLRSIADQNDTLRDRYLYELLFHELVHVDHNPLRHALSDDDHERLAIRVQDLITPLHSGSDWTPLFDELTGLREQLAAALRSATSESGAGALVVATRTACDALGSSLAQIIDFEDALARPAQIRGRDVQLLAPDLRPGARERARMRLLAAGAANTRDLLHQLAATPCAFHTNRFNTLPREMRDELYRRGEYWDYYLAQSGTRAENSPPKQSQCATIAEVVDRLEPRKLLEYGCGDGRILQGLLPPSKTDARALTGVDASERMLQLARARLSSDPRVRLLPADARDTRRPLPFEDACFDATLTCGALQHVLADELAPVVAELQRVTRDTLLHWEAFEALQPGLNDHYTNPDTSRALHRAAFDRYGPLRTSVRDVRPITGQPVLFCEYHVREPLITILTLHAIARPPVDVESFDYRNMFLAPESFADLLDGLRSAGYSFLTVGEAAACMRGERPTPNRAIVLTFDDGYASVFDAAFPLMHDRGIRGAAFIPTDFIGGVFAGNTRSGVGPALRTMTEAQLRTLRTAGWDIGAHSCSHPVFATLNDAAARREMQGSRARLESILGESTSLFAFPYGEPGVAFTASQVELARDCGFELILSTRPGFIGAPPPSVGWVEQSETHQSVPWPRIGVDHDASSASLLNDLARIHRETSGWPAAAPAGPTLDDRVRRMVQQCVKQGVRRIALYGAGQHTARLLQSTPLWPLDVLAIVDDDTRLSGTRRYGLPVCGPAQLAMLDLDAILISSDRYEDAIYDRLAPLETRGVHVLRLYSENPRASG